MKDNIRPDHYRTGEIDLYEAFSQIFPHNEYRAGMQMIAMRYMFRDKNDRVEDLNKAIYTLERLKEKEIEHDDRYKEIPTKDGALHAKGESKNVYDDGVSVLWADNEPTEIVDSLESYEDDAWQTKIKTAGQYIDDVYRYHDDLLKRLRSDDYKYLARDYSGYLFAYAIKPKKDKHVWTIGFDDCSFIKNDNFPGIKWTDDEPTKIADLLASYENGGENGKWEVE